MDTLEEPFQNCNGDYEGWDLVITGHSLGAGVAALLAMKAKSIYKNTRCWAMNPPGITVVFEVTSYQNSIVASPHLKTIIFT